MNKKGFTLIELLAVIIILGILMIIAIPSVTKYISDSRKSSYVDTAKEVIGAARNLVNSGDLEMYDTNTTYYIPVDYIKTENALKSPYGDFVSDAAYVVVTYDGKGYNYYWISVDDAGQGVKEIVSFDKLDTDNIESDIDPNDVKYTVEHTGIGNREYVKVLKSDGTWNEPHMADDFVPEEGASSRGSNVVCKPATILHTKRCEMASSGYGCEQTVGNRNTITYGTLVSESPKSGDAYDCDVNNDGTYDPSTERFYYVTSEGENSILIYYTNMNDQAIYAYATQIDAQLAGTCTNENGCNWYGPLTGYQYLPNSTEWSNPGLIAPGMRSIVTENGSASTSGGSIESFVYTGKVARFLTAQEVNSACEITVGSKTTGELDNCSWLMENIEQYEKSSGNNGYWLETPNSSSNSRVWSIIGNYRRVHYNHANSTTYYGVRPVITVKTSDIEQ